jgi:hypothetical protein
MRTSLTLALLLACACRSREPAPSPLPSAAEAGANAAAIDAGAAAATTPDPARLLRQEGEALLARWLEAQNRGDHAAYAALYQPAHFQGIKRTASGKVRRYDGTGWVRDRKRMFEVGFKVAAEELAVETWLDADSKLKTGVISLRFLQRWEGGGYADHGIKVLQAWRDAKGAWRLVYEDLLNAEPGWARAADAVAALALTAPADDAAALALWTVVAPTGADYEDRLAAIPDDPAIRRPMARALLAAGNLACTETIDAGACGEEILEWAPLDPKADLASPCLRRRLALWAVDQLDDADIAGLTTALAGLVALKAPEIELPTAAFAALPAGADDVRLTLLAASADADREALAESEVAGLTTDAAIVTAATALHLDRAVERLDRTRHRGPLLAAIGDDKLEVATRVAIVDGFAGDGGKDVTAALVALASDGSCELAMLAAAALADRGDPSRLPSRPAASGSDADLQRVLCLVSHDRDLARRDARWRELLAPTVIERAITTNDFGDPDEAGDEADATDPDAPEGTIVTGGDGIGTTTNTWKTTARDALDLGGTLQAWAGCAGGCTDQGDFELVIARDERGRRWITEIIEKRWMGCPC